MSTTTPITYQITNLPAAGVVAITPANSDLLQPIRAFYVGTTGDVTLTGLNGASVTFVLVPAGVLMPVAAVRISATGTTASNIVGLY